MSTTYSDDPKVASKFIQIKIHTFSKIEIENKHFVSINSHSNSKQKKKQNQTTNQFLK